MHHSLGLLGKGMVKVSPLLYHPTAGVKEAQEVRELRGSRTSSQTSFGRRVTNHPPYSWPL